MNADNKLLETVFVIAICCLSDYKQQSKIMLQYLITFVDSINVFDCRLSSVFWYTEDVAKTIWYKG